MTGLIIKVFMCPLALIISDLLFDQVNYRNFYQPIVVGLILAISAHLMELMILRRGTVWISLVVDVIAATFIVYLISNLFPGARVTFSGAVFSSLVVGATEYVQHLYLTESGKTRKGF